MSLLPFTPLGSTASASMSNTAVTTALTAVPDGGGTIRVYNGDTVTVFILFGTSSGMTVPTVSTGHPLKGGETQDFECGPQITHISHIALSAATLKIYATTGKAVR